MFFFSKLKDESKVSRFLFPFEIHSIYIFLKIDICDFFRRKIPFGSQYLLFCEPAAGRNFSMSVEDKY